MKHKKESGGDDGAGAGVDGKVSRSLGVERNTRPNLHRTARATVNRRRRAAAVRCPRPLLNLRRNRSQRVRCATTLSNLTPFGNSTHALPHIAQASHQCVTCHN